jgi:hypothetical protein
VNRREVVLFTCVLIVILIAVTTSMLQAPTYAQTPTSTSTSTPTPTSSSCDPHCSAVRYIQDLAENKGIRQLWGTWITNADPYLEYGTVMQAVWLHAAISSDPVLHWLEIGVTKSSNDHTKKVYAICGGCFPDDPASDWTFGQDLDEGGTGVRFFILYDSSKSTWYWYGGGKEIVHRSISSIGNSYLPENMRILGTGGEVGGSSNNDMGVGETVDLRYTISNCYVLPCSFDYVPEDSRGGLMPAGPPPWPQRYYTNWIASQRKLQTTSDCHHTHSCHPGR